MTAVLLAWAGAAGLTALVETGFLALVGYRRRAFVIGCVLVNLASNLTLNLGLSFSGDWFWRLLWPAEALVVVIEWFVLRLLVDRSASVGRLFAFVLLANLLSLGLGLILLGG